MNASCPNRLREFLSYHLPPMIYALAILALSMVPDLSAPGGDWPGKDKVAHLLEYSLFGLLCLRSLARLVAATSLRQAYLLAVGLLLIFAAFDEYVQSFTPGRHASLADYLVDLAGGTLALWLLGKRVVSANRLSSPK